MKRWMFVLTASTLTFSLAHAHATLKTSVPADGANVATAPHELRLTFSEKVTLTLLSIQQNGKDKQDVGPLPKKPESTFTLPLPALGTGGYTVEWRALADDAHVMTGHMAFGVGTAVAPAEHMDHGAHGDHAGHGDAHDHAEHP
jgi:copper resistance protein C